MAKEVKKENKAAPKKAAKPDGFMYKGYDIRWLKGIGDKHPDFHLVAEFEAGGEDKKEE